MDLSQVRIQRNQAVSCRRQNTVSDLDVSTYLPRRDTSDRSIVRESYVVSLTMLSPRPYTVLVSPPARGSRPSCYPSPFNLLLILPRWVYLSSFYRVGLPPTHITESPHTRTYLTHTPPTCTHPHPHIFSVPPS